MTEKSNFVRRLLIAFVLQAIVTGQSMAQSPDRTPQAVDNHPLNPEKILEDIVPQPGALIPYGVPNSWFDFKDDVYDKIGLKFGVSYQMLMQSASDTLPNSKFDTALGDWWGFLTKWTLLNRGTENEGTLVFSMFERGAVGNNAVPADFGIGDVGVKPQFPPSRNATAYSNAQPPSMAKNCDVWNVPLPSIRVATKYAASSGRQRRRIGTPASTSLRLAGSLSAPTSCRKLG